MKKRKQRPIKIVSIPPDYFKEVVEKAHKNETFWKPLSHFEDVLNAPTLSDIFKDRIK